jgi:hypothetical protein
MKTKVINAYRTELDIIKRETQGVVWSFVWAFLLVGWITFMLIVSFRTGFWSLPTGDFFVLFLVCNFPTLIFGAGFFYMLKHEQHVKTIWFKIHSYERWNWELSKYETFYLTEQVTLNATYIFQKHTGDFIDEMSQEELEERCKSLTGNFFVGHETQEEAMREILSTIKDLIANEKAAENIEIKNVSTLETFSAKELKEKFSNGEFNHLYETKED